MDKKPRVNEILKDYEVTLDKLVPGKQYLVEHTYYGPNGNHSSKSKGFFLHKDKYSTAYFSEPDVEYDPDDFVQVVTPDSQSRFYEKPSDLLKQKSLERQAIGQAINKQTTGYDWRAKKNRSSIGTSLAKEHTGGRKKTKRNRKYRTKRNRKYIKRTSKKHSRL